MNDRNNDGRLRFRDYNGYYSSYDIWGQTIRAGEEHLIHPSFAKLYIQDDKQISLYTKKWAVSVKADDTITIFKAGHPLNGCTTYDDKETELVVNALQNPLEERNRLAIKIMDCDDDTLMRLKLFLGGE